MKNTHSINLKQYLARTGLLAIPLALALLLAVALPGLIWAATFITTVDTGTNALGDAGQAGSVALKSNGLAVISYWDKTAGNVGDLKVAFCNDPACSNPTIQSIDDMENARTTSVALTGSDVPVISYPGLNGVQVAFCNSATDCSSPITRTIDSGVTALYSSLALNSSGFPVVSYSEGLVVPGQTFARLKVAFCQDAACNSVTTRVVAGDGTTTTTGEYNSLTLTGGDVPVISYAEQSSASGGRLMLATCESATDCSSPTINIVDNSNPVNALPSLLGRYSSLALNSSGFPVISYYEERGFDLKLAVCSDALCSSSVFSTTVDTAGDVGQYSSLALNSSGFPVISYVDLTNTALKLATCNDATCSSSPTLQTLDNTGAVGQYASLALNSTDGPAVSYYDVSNKDLKLYTNTTGCNTSSWTANNEASLNAAIGCFNKQTAAGSYTITVTADIPLTASTIAINNVTSGVSLDIVGGGYEVDGQDITGVRPFQIRADTTVTMNDLIVTGGNVVDARGGGIRNDGTLTINDSEIFENEAQGFQSTGGGIFNNGNLTLVRTIVSDNDANTWYGGGIYNDISADNLTVIDSTISGNSAARGGGIYNNSNTPVAVSNSTISGNSANGDGGGIYNTSASTTTVRNSTISGNTAGTLGGGIHNTSIDLTLDSVTITGNTASDGGALYSTFAAQPTVQNSILANSVSTNDCFSPGGTITDGGHNLIGTQSGCGFTNGVNGTIVGSDPLLGPLADNGGETETHALLGGSPAIDAGSTSLTTDQRGIARPSGAGDDIGAYESFCGTATSWAAGSELELDAAIGCFNKQTVAQSYTITVTGNISLTSSIAAIDNPTSGPSLVIVGGNHTIDGNLGAGGFVIDSPTAVSITDLTVTRSRQLLTGGAIRNPNGGALTLNNVTLTQNRAGFGGGALSSTGPVTITNSVISHNYNPAGKGGGGILIESPGSLTLIDSEVSDNTTDVLGGGIYAESGANLTITRSTISGNSATRGGGGLANFGSLSVGASTLSDNSATGELGGGIYNADTGSLILTNSTLSGNNADLGGGIYNDGALDLDSVTIANNTVTIAGSINGGGALYAGGDVTMTNSILAGSIGSEDCYFTGLGSFVSGENNLIETQTIGDCGIGGDIVNTDPKLGPLADNGGETETHALLNGSPAIDTGSTSLTSDQRGIARPFGFADDMGAVESQLPGTIIISKQASASGSFTFTHNITSPTSFTLSQGQSQTFTNVTAGTYTVTEATSPGWQLVNLSCSDGTSVVSSTVNLSAGQAIINLEPGETVTCTYVNGEDDVIIVAKETWPNGGTGFDFAISGGGDSDTFSLDDGGLQIYEVISASYTITETNSSADYYLVSAECTIFGPNPGDETTVAGNVANGTVDLSLTTGQAAFCLFESEEYGSITVVKEANPTDGTDFDFTLRGDATQDFTLDHAVPDDNDGISQSISFTLKAGNYELTEVNLPAGWDNINLRCQSPGNSTLGQDTAALKQYIQLEAGDDVTCTYRNGKHADLTIVKEATPADNTTFNFALSDGYTAVPFSLQDPISNTRVLNDLPAHTYYVGEFPDANWDLTDIKCASNIGGQSVFDVDLANGAVEIDLAPGDDATCTFRNSRLDPVMNLSGNGVTIHNGETTPNPASGTDFGSATVGDTVVRTFTINNPGTTTPLSLGGISLVGGAAGDFSVTVQPSATITPGGSTTFQISFTPSAEGARQTTVQILSSDPNQPTYAFAIGGTGLAAQVPAAHIGVTGQGRLIPNGDLTPSPTDDTDFGTVTVMPAGTMPLPAGTYIVTHTFSIKNSGNAPLDLSGGVQLNGSGDFVVVGQPATTVAPGTETTFGIAFAPGSPGLKDATVSLTSNDSSRSPYIFHLQGMGVELPVPHLDVVGNSLHIANNDNSPGPGDGTDFGTLAIAGGRRDRTFSLSNSGTANLDLANPAIEISGAAASDFMVVANPQSSIAPNGQTDFTIRFVPSAPGLRSAVISISSNDTARNPYRFTVWGRGQAVTTTGGGTPHLSILWQGVTIQKGDVQQSPVDGTDFGSVVSGTSRSRTFDLFNTGLGDLSISAIALNGAPAFSISQAPHSPLNAGSQTKLQIAYNPTSLGLHAAQVVITHSDSPRNPFTFVVVGNSTAGTEPFIQLLGNQQQIFVGDGLPNPADGTDFGSVTSQSERTFTILNAGSAPLNLSGTPLVDLLGSEAADYSLVLTPTAILSPGAKSNFTLRFEPGADGLRRATVSISNTDTGRNPFTFGVWGTGKNIPTGYLSVLGLNQVIANGSANPAAIDNTAFGLLTTGETQEHQFTLHNGGDASLNLTGTPYVSLSGANASQFSISAQPGSPIGPNGGVSHFTIDFAPTISGTITATVSIESDDTARNPYTFVIGGQGKIGQTFFYLPLIAK